MAFAASAVFITLAAAATVANAQSPSVTTPSLTQCASSVINYSGSAPPYYVAILTGQDPCNNDAIQEFHDVYDTSVSYTPVLASGTQVLVYVEDANGNEAWSDTITIGGGDSSCLNPAPPAQAPPAQAPPAQDAPTQSAPPVDTPVDAPTTDSTPVDTTEAGADTQDLVNTTTTEDSTSAVEESTSTVVYYTPSSSDDEVTRSTLVLSNKVATPTNTVGISNDDSGVNIQNTNTDTYGSDNSDNSNSNNSNSNSNSNNSNNTPLNAANGATGLAVSAFTALFAVAAVSVGLF